MTLLLLLAYSVQYWSGALQMQPDGRLDHSYYTYEVATIANPPLPAPFAADNQIGFQVTGKLAAAAPVPPEPPKITSAFIDYDQRAVRISWTHASCTTFAIRCLSEKASYTNGWHTAGEAGKFQFVFKLVGLTNRFSIQAVDNRLVSQWSKPITIESTQ